MAPRARANAVRKPLVVMLKKPKAAIPSKVNQRNPDSISCSEMVGLGLRNLNNLIFDIGILYKWNIKPRFGRALLHQKVTPSAFYLCFFLAFHPSNLSNSPTAESADLIGSSGWILYVFLTPTLVFEI